jgi:hypothetical protein
MRREVSVIVRKGQGKSGIPVNVLPNTNSFAGSNSFGVVVFVIVNLDGSISCALTFDAALAWMLYNLDC